MKRRTYLVGLVASMSAGCLDRLFPGDETENQRETNTDTATKNDQQDTSVKTSFTDNKDDINNSSHKLLISGIYPDEVERTFFDYEYIELKNERDKKIDVSGYTVNYDGSHTYTISNLILEPDALLVISSRSGDDTTLARSPPIYHRFAGFGSGKKTSVLDGTGTITVRTPNSEVVDEETY